MFDTIMRVMAIWAVLSVAFAVLWALFLGKREDE
jgi:hypothetical protein